MGRLAKLCKKLTVLGQLEVAELSLGGILIILIILIIHSF